MPKPEINLIAAMAEDRVIGDKGEMPWKIRGELKRFREITTPHPVIMGRKTFDSIGMVLQDRPNLIVSRDDTFTVQGATVFPSIDAALGKAKELDQEKIFIIGGGNIFEQTIGMADKLYLTLIHKPIPGDTVFPDYSAFTHEISREDHEQDGIKFSYVILEKP